MLMLLKRDLDERSYLQQQKYLLEESGGLVLMYSSLWGFLCFLITRCQLYSGKDNCDTILHSIQMRYNLTNFYPVVWQQFFVYQFQRTRSEKLQQPLRDYRFVYISRQHSPVETDLLNEMSGACDVASTLLYLLLVQF